jgi:hypothetical protein
VNQLRGLSPHRRRGRLATTSGNSYSVGSQAWYYAARSWQITGQGNPMNTLKTVLLVVIFVSLYPARLSGAEFKVDFRSDGKSVAVIALTIDGDMAKTKVDDEVEQFNLKDQSWLDAKTGKWVTLVQCKHWAEQSKAKSLPSVQKAPENMRSFLQWSLDPNFKIEKPEGALRLKSGQVDYVIEGSASKANIEKYFRYAELNAYKKAMTARKLPPFAELKAIEEMNKLGHIPRKMTVTIPGVPKSPMIEIEVTEIKP